MAAVAAAHRHALDRPVVPQVLARHAPARRLDGGRDVLGGHPVIERARAVARDRRQRVGKIALDQRVARLQRAAVRLEKDFRRRGPARQPGLRARQRVGDIVLDRQAGARKLDRGGHQLGQREFAGAVFRVRERQPRHRAGDADREPAVARLARVGLAVLVEEDVARRGGGRGLAVVDRGVDVAVGEMNQHVAAAADIAGARIGHGERKSGGDRGVDRVAAPLQHVGTDACRARLLRDHHAVARDDLLGTPDQRRRRGILRRQRRGAGGERNQQERPADSSGDHLKSRGSRADVPPAGGNGASPSSIGTTAALQAMRRDASGALRLRLRHVNAGAAGARHPPVAACSACEHPAMNAPSLFGGLS